MKSGSTRKLSPKLVATRREFARWRRSRKAGERIPEELWGGAVKLAGELGLNPTAQALRLDYYSLKKRVDTAGVSGTSTSSTPGAAGAFVEIPAAAIAAPPECIVELEHPCGAKMRINLRGAFTAELAALAGTFCRS